MGPELSRAASNGRYAICRIVVLLGCAAIIACPGGPGAQPLGFPGRTRAPTVAQARTRVDMENPAPYIWPANELEEVLAASLGNPSATPRLMEVLSRSHVWVPLPNGGSPESTDLDLP